MEEMEEMEERRSQSLDKDQQNLEEEKRKRGMERGRGLCLKRGLSFDLALQWTVTPAPLSLQLLTSLYPLSPHDAPPTALHSASPLP